MRAQPKHNCWHRVLAMTMALWSSPGPAAMITLISTAVDDRHRAHVKPAKYFMNDPDGVILRPGAQDVSHIRGDIPATGIAGHRDTGIAGHGGLPPWAQRCIVVDGSGRTCVADQVLWKRLPDALVPDLAHRCDATGAHSGSVTLVGGDPVKLYTGSLPSATGRPGCRAGRSSARQPVQRLALGYWRP